MENNKQLDELFKKGQEIFKQATKFLGGNHDEKFENTQRLSDQLAIKNLETVQAAKSWLKDAAKWKEITEENPRSELTKEIDNEITELIDQIKMTETHIDRLHGEKVQAKIDAIPYPVEIVEWNKKYINNFYPKRIREIEAVRLKASQELPGFGDPPKYTKSLDTIKSEVLVMERQNEMLQKRVDQMRANKKKTLELKVEVEQIEMDVLRIAERNAKFEEKEAQLIREISELEIEKEALEKLRQDDASTDENSDDDDDQVIDLTGLFKDPNDFPVLMNFLSKVHSKSPKMKTPEKVKATNSATPEKSKKRKLSSHAGSSKVSESPAKRLTRSNSSGRLSLPRSGKSPKDAPKRQSPRHSHSRVKEVSRVTFSMDKEPINAQQLSQGILAAQQSVSVEQPQVQNESTPAIVVHSIETITETAPAQNANVNKTPEANKNKSPDANKNKTPDANKKKSPDSNKKKSPDANKKKSPDANKKKSPDANKKKSPDANKKKSPDANKKKPNEVLSRNNSVSSGDDSLFNMNNDDLAADDQMNISGDDVFNMSDLEGDDVSMSNDDGALNFNFAGDDSRNNSQEAAADDFDFFGTTKTSGASGTSAAAGGGMDFGSFF